MKLVSRRIESPVGRILLAGMVRAGEARLVCARVIESDEEVRAWAEARGVQRAPDDGSLAAAGCAFDDYFAGRLRDFNIPIEPAWGTPFQRAVWDALRKIPYGKTMTYGSLARALGFPTGASRAVGSANGANPVFIAIPCHRVVREPGGPSRSEVRSLKRALGGFAYGLWRKEHLLRLEGAWPVQPALL